MAANLFQEITMNREQIIDFIQQTQVMLQQLGEMQKGINQGKALKEMLTSQGEVERALEMAKELAKVEKSYEASSQALLRKCKRDTITGCETLLADIVERLKLADTSFDNWRTMLAAHELETQLSPNQEARALRETALAEIKQRFDAALENTSQAVPAPGVVLL
jgi:hypothetical protein